MSKPVEKADYTIGSGDIARHGSKYSFLFTKGGFDIPFFILVMALLTVGLIMLFSASYVYAFYYESDGSYHFIKNQLVFAGIGFVLMLLTSRINYRLWKAAAPFIFGIGIILLIVVFAMPAYEGKWHRWIYLGPVSFQPSEIAKFAVIIFFGYLTERLGKKVELFRGFALYVVFLALVCGLVILEPHLSGTILIACLGLIAMIVGGVKKRYILIMLLIGIAALGIYLFGIKGIDYVGDRFKAWTDKGYDPLGDRWQVNQSLYAIGSGGLLGTGIGNSKQKFLYVSEPQNDFIFAIVCEELGFIGALIIMLLFVLLVWRGCVIAMKCPDKFGMITAFGIVAQIGIQAALNIAVVTDTLPNTGVSLPFFSYGGTALVMVMIQMGIVLSISRGKTDVTVQSSVGTKLKGSRFGKIINKMF